MRLLRWINMLSIDVAVAAAFLCLAMAKLWQIEMSLSVPVILAIIVWLIYTLDHIKDARDTLVPGLSARRDFHRKHVKSLIRVCILLLLIASGLLFTLSANLLLYGSVLACLVMAYYLAMFFLHRYAPFRKELIVALLYTAGIVIGPLSYGDPPDGYQIHIFQLFLLAFNNLILFSWFDHDLDKAEGFSGIVQKMGPVRSRHLLLILPVIQMALAAVLYATGIQKGFELMWLFICLVMLILPASPEFWSQQGRYRVVGDLLFFVPSLFILFPYEL